MPLNDEVVALLGNKFTADQILEQLLPDAQTKLTANGHVIRKKEDDDSYVASKAKELKDAEIGTHVGYAAPVLRRSDNGFRLYQKVK